MIREVIVVEGRDDESAVRRAVAAQTIATHGYGIRAGIWSILQKAYETNGLIIFTDPDHAGEQIRKRLLSRFPNSKQAFLPRDAAERNGDIGIENASPESIRLALAHARSTTIEKTEQFSRADLYTYGLEGVAGATERRDRMGALLGIGYGNAKTFLARLNHFGIDREEFEQAWTSSIHQDSSGV